MNCTEFERAMHEAVEERREGDLVVLREHAAACPSCSAAWEEHKLLERAVAEWKLRVPECDLVDFVLTQLDQTALPQPSRSRSHAAVGDATAFGPSPKPTLTTGAHRVVAVAALTLLLVWGVLSFGPRQPDSQSNIARDDDPKSAVDLQPAVRDAELDVALRDAGTAYAELARGAASAFTDARLLLAGSIRPASKEPASPPARPALIDQWRRELQPLEEDVNRAVDFLLRAVPDDAAPAT